VRRRIEAFIVMDVVPQCEGWKKGSRWMMIGRGIVGSNITGLGGISPGDFHKQSRDTATKSS